MYREYLIKAIKDSYQEEVRFNEQLDHFTTWVQDYFDGFKDLETISQKSSLNFEKTKCGIGINDYVLRFKVYGKTISVNITPELGDPEAVIDEYRYSDGIFVNRNNQPLTFELMDGYVKRAFDGRWDKGRAAKK